jgi:acetoin utilization deacetylase AcuC-like enzyme
MAPRIPDAAIRPIVERDAVEWIVRVHSRQYHDWVRQSCADGVRCLDQGDTVVCPQSYNAAIASVDAGLTAADLVMSGEFDRAFSAMRPPGHHALPDRAMGFCLFANVAIVARYLQARHAVGRIAVVDWDVHHGNGTHDIFYDDDSVLFISLHQYPLWPGTGSSRQRGTGRGEGFTLNLPIAPYTPASDYMQTFRDGVLPALDKYAPELLLISAGFDAHRDDPIAQLRLTEDDFAAMTRHLAAVAAASCGGRIISLLEGGYNLDALSASVAAHVNELAE